MSITIDKYTEQGNGGENITVDGRVFASKVEPGETFTNLRNGINTSVTAQPTATVSYVELAAGTVTDRYLRLAKCFFTFDTSEIGTGTIISASFNFYTTSRGSTLGTSAIHLVESFQQYDNAVYNSDYLSVGSASFGSMGINSSEMVLNTYNAININTDGISTINKTGITKYALVLEWDLNNNFTGTWLSSGYSRVYIRQADIADINYTPFLSVTYEINNQVIKKNKYQMMM